MTSAPCRPLCTINGAQRVAGIRGIHSQQTHFPTQPLSIPHAPEALGTAPNPFPPATQLSHLQFLLQIETQTRGSGQHSRKRGAGGTLAERAPDTGAHLALQTAERPRLRGVRTRSLRSDSCVPHKWFKRKRTGNAAQFFPLEAGRPPLVIYVECSKEGTQKKSGGGRATGKYPPDPKSQTHTFFGGKQNCRNRTFPKMRKKATS